MVENVSDYQLLIDSNLLKDLLRLIDNSDVVIEFFSHLLLDFISDEKKCFLQFLVDDIGALSSLINIMHRLTWEDVLEMDSYIRVIDSAKFAVRAVMKSEERYKEMVSQMEIPGSLKTELMNGMWMIRKQEAAFLSETHQNWWTSWTGFTRDFADLVLWKKKARRTGRAEINDKKFWRMSIGEQRAREVVYYSQAMLTRQRAQGSLSVEDLEKVVKEQVGPISEAVKKLREVLEEIRQELLTMNNNEALSVLQDL
jgi:hypothetical protein